MGICNWIGIEEAFVYLQKMLNDGNCPNFATWNLLVQSLFSDLGHLGPVYISDDITANKYDTFESECFFISQAVGQIASYQ